MSDIENMRSELHDTIHGLPIQEIEAAGEHSRRAADGMAAAGIGTDEITAAQEHIHRAAASLGACASEAVAYLADIGAPAAMPDRPLFALIDRQGDPGLPEHDKLERVFDVGPLLVRLGVNPRLAAEIAQAAEMLGPLGALVLGRRPAAAERSLLEGRGAYHADIPVAGTNVTVYVKGTGNEATFDGEQGTFTGFPGSADDLFFDDISRAHPRMVGTETVRWGMLEAINGAFVFAYLARQYGWERLSDAIAAGVTIPLNVLHQKELSAYTATHLAKIRAGEVNIFDEQGLEWDGNEKLGTVSMIVPGDRRITHNGDNMGEQTIAHITDPAITAVAGRTLRTLAQAGICYSGSSAHGQNLYTEGLVAQADNSDLVTLGDYHDRREEWGTDHNGRPIYKTVTASEQRQALLMAQFERDAHMAPSGRPLVHEVYVSWEQALNASTAFWKELLRDVADQSAVEQAMHYLPFMRTEFNAAAASLLIEQYSTPEWDAMAAHKRDILAGHEASYGLLTEYKEKVRANTPDMLDLFLGEVISEGKLASKPLEQFLRTGDIRALHADTTLRPAMELTRTIEAIPDRRARDELLSACADAFGKKDLYDLSKEPDIVRAYEGRHYQALARLISHGRLEEAHDFIQTVTLTRNASWGGIRSTELTGEYNRHKYRRLLLNGNLSPTEVYETAVFDHTLWPLAVAAGSGGLSLTEILDAEIKGRELPPTVSAHAEARGLPRVKEVVTQILTALAEQREHREAITDWLARYGETASEIRSARLNPARISAVLDELDTMAAEVADTYPELELLHASYAAGRAARVDKDRARHYLERGIAYYDSHLTERARFSRRRISSWQEPTDSLKKPGARDALVARYELLGFKELAAYYRTVR